MSNNQQPQERIDILENILLRLHHGASPEEVQADFDEHFTGVSAIEISMMEHQLMYGDSEITFEDVLKLCNVHANLFKNAVKDGETPDADKPGHPVQVFKDENNAFRAALMRINNLLNVLGELPKEELEDGMLRGLRRQFDLLGQFDVHYERKEKLFFPKMEYYGHDAPPKVMWAKDDEIRDQFKAAYKKMEQFPNIPMSEVKEAFAEFEFEFNEMIFKEEAILINILLEALTVEDWYQIAQESDAYGFAIIRPSEEWVPDSLNEAEDDKKVIKDLSTSNMPLPIQQVVSQSDATLESRKIAVDGGYITVTFEPDSASTRLDPNRLDRFTEIKIGDGFLNRDQINLVLDYTPMEITVVNEQDIVIYSNFNEKWLNRTFNIRQYNTLGRSVETLYKRPLKGQVMALVEQFRKGNAKDETIIHTMSDKLVKIDLYPQYSQSGQYVGYVEFLINLDYIDRVNTRMKRELTPIEAYENETLYLSDVKPLKQTETKHEFPTTSETSLTSHKLNFSDGSLMLTWENSQNTIQEDQLLDYDIPLKLRNGQLSLDQLKVVLNLVPFEISFVDHEDIFQYFNNIAVTYKDMIFVRTPAQIKRNLELCHPPFLWPMISQLIQSFRERKRYFEELWYPTGNNEYIYIIYQATYDLEGNFTGMIETVIDIQPFMDIKQAQQTL